MSTEVSEQTPPVQSHYHPSSRIPWILAGFVVLAGIYGAFKWWQVEQARLDRGTAVPVDAVGPPVTQFELTERSGETFRSADMKGRVWVATYFFSTCPGSCIRLNQNIQTLHNLPELEDVTWVSITCDPDTDTLEVLQDYADRWEADPQRWLFCRGDLDYIKQVGLGMAMPIYRRGHKDYAIVFDKAGKLRGALDATRKSDIKRLRTLLLTCLDEGPSEEIAVESTET